MNNQTLLDAINGIDDKYIYSAQQNNSHCNQHTRHRDNELVAHFAHDYCSKHQHKQAENTKSDIYDIYIKVIGKVQKPEPEKVHQHKKKRYVTTLIFITFLLNFKRNIMM